jgi:hypothetical protein
MAFAEEKAAKEGGKKAPDPLMKSGLVGSVDAAANTFVLKAKDGEKTIKVTADTKYELNKAASTQADVLKAGAKVKVTLTAADGDTAAAVSATTGERKPGEGHKKAEGKGEGKAEGHKKAEGKAEAK